MTTYAYPDPTEGITAAMIGLSEEDRGYWSQSESVALKIAARCVADHFGPGRVRAAIDVGTGEGRLLPWLADSAHTIAAVDPDPERVATASNRWTATGRADTTITFVTDLATCAPTGSSAVILCSHVLQHIPVQRQRELLDDVSALASDDAALILLFTQGTTDESFVLERTAAGQHVVEPTDQATFEAHASTPVDGVLPVRFVRPEDVRTHLATHGWREHSRWEHHVRLENRTPSILDDLVANADSAAEQPSPARDILMIFTRGDQ